jgi:hypothetical protein
MARDEAPLWPRGSTWYNLFSQSGQIDQQNLGGGNVLGKEWRHEDTTYGTNQYVTVRAVRNTGTFALLGGRMCGFDPAYPMNAVNGYTMAVYQPGLILDEFLPPTGLPPGDIGWAIMEGPCLAQTPLDGGADNVINYFDPLAANAAAASNTTTAGRVATSGTGGGAGVRDGLLNVVGRAISAKTTANTGQGVLVNVQRLF